MRKNKKLTILKADKGNVTVVINTTNHKQKMRNILQENCYKPIKSDPTTYLEKTINSKIQQSSLDPNTNESLCRERRQEDVLKNSVCPKIHKTGAPLRPIASAFDSLQRLEKHLANIM